MRKNSSACDPLQGPFLGLFAAWGPGQAGFAHVEGTWTSDAGAFHDIEIVYCGGNAWPGAKPQPASPAFPPGAPSPALSCLPRARPIASSCAAPIPIPFPPCTSTAFAPPCLRPEHGPPRRAYVRQVGNRWQPAVVLNVGGHRIPNPQRVRDTVNLIVGAGFCLSA